MILEWFTLNAYTHFWYLLEYTNKHGTSWPSCLFVCRRLHLRLSKKWFPLMLFYLLCEDYFWDIWLSHPYNKHQLSTIKCIRELQKDADSHISKGMKNDIEIIRYAEFRWGIKNLITE